MGGGPFRSLIFLPFVKYFEDTLAYLVGDHIIIQGPVGEIGIGYVINLTFGKQAQSIAGIDVGH